MYSGDIEVIPFSINQRTTTSLIVNIKVRVKYISFRMVYNFECNGIYEASVKW